MLQPNSVCSREHTCSDFKHNKLILVYVLEYSLGKSSKVSIFLLRVMTTNYSIQSRADKSDDITVPDRDYFIVYPQTCLSENLSLILQPENQLSSHCQSLVM
jgi:hypothetical protein